MISIIIYYCRCHRYVVCLLVGLLQTFHPRQNSIKTQHFPRTLFTLPAFLNTKHLKNVGPIRHCEPPHSIHQVSLLSHAACASMSTTTTTTTRDRGDRYGPIEWAQLHAVRAKGVRLSSAFRSYMKLKIAGNADCSIKTKTVISARRNIYISRLCYDVSVRLSVCDGSALAHYS